MLVYTTRPKDQKELFFKLKTAMKISDYDTDKIEGLYVIFIEGICVYVGMSTNIPSRLATHLSGKYKYADKIIVFKDEGDGGKLEESEKRLIQLFSPTENKLIDYSEKINDDLIFPFLWGIDNADQLEDASTYEIITNKHDLLIIHSEILPMMYSNDEAIESIDNIIKTLKGAKNG